MIAELGPKTPTWTAIRLACRRRNISMDMRLCRKIHASWLHQCEVSDLLIDFLQGRVATSVFSRHYLTPNQQDLKDKVLDAREKLKQEIEQ